MSSRPPIPIKVLCTGDGMVGKTALLHRFTTPEEEFLEEYQPTIFEEYLKTETARSGQVYEMTLVDTAGQEDLAAIMAYSFNDTDVFLVCFSPTESNSFMNIKLRWLNMIQEASYKKNTVSKPEIILVMTKVDLLSDEATLALLESKSKQVITRDKAERLRKEIDAFKLVECSSRNGTGIQDVFKAAIEAVDRHQGEGCLRRYCEIL